MKTLSLTHTTRTYPKLPYQNMKDVILGKTYILSLVFVGEKRAQKINEETRKKAYVPNVLSFPLDTNAGEIYITPIIAQKEAKAFSLTEKGYVAYLFIHGLLHLKGLDHGSKMDSHEKKYMKLFNVR